MANQLTPNALLALNATNVRIVKPIGVSVFTETHAHVFAMPADPAKLKAFCWANHIPFEGHVDEPNSTVEPHTAIAKRTMSDAELLTRMKIANGELPDPQAHGSLNAGQFGH